jgi:hypothetical protein
MQQTLNNLKPAPLAVPQVEAARLLGVTDRTIRNWDRAGVLVGRKVRGVKLYPVAELKKVAGVE